VIVSKTDQLFWIRSHVSNNILSETHLYLEPKQKLKVNSLYKHISQSWKWFSLP